MPGIEVNGAWLDWRESGEGAPVVALHGSASAGGQWRSLAGYLAGRYRVVTPDLPGYGRSGPGRGGAPGLALDAGAIAELVARIGAPAHLVGHSYGGAVALKLARMRPDLVRSLVLIEPAAFHVLRDAPRADRALRFDIGRIATRIAAGARSGQRASAMAEFVDFWVGEGAWSRTSPELRDRLAGALDATLANFAAIAWETDRLADYARLSAPTLLAYGLESRPVAMRTTELLAERIPQAQLRMIPGAGHLAPLTDPHVVDPMIAGHIRAAEAGALHGRRRAA